MKAVDTNVLVRFFVNDPEDAQAAKQRPAAVAAMAKPVFVPSTVLLEFEWVLRGFYAFKPREVAGVLRALAGIEHVTLENRAQALGALDALEHAGLDFADAMHLAHSSHCQGLLTFDKDLGKRATRLSLMPVVEVLK